MAVALESLQQKEPCRSFSVVPPVEQHGGENLTSQSEVQLALPLLTTVSESVLPVNRKAIVPGPIQRTPEDRMRQPELWDNLPRSVRRNLPVPDEETRRPMYDRQVELPDGSSVLYQEALILERFTWDYSNMWQMAPDVGSITVFNQFADHSDGTELGNSSANFLYERAAVGIDMGVNGVMYTRHDVPAHQQFNEALGRGENPAPHNFTERFIFHVPFPSIKDDNDIPLSELPIVVNKADKTVLYDQTVVQDEEGRATMVIVSFFAPASIEKLEDTLLWEGRNGSEEDDEKAYNYAQTEEERSDSSLLSLYPAGITTQVFSP